MWPQNQFVFTLPACGFVVALNLDWCPDAHEAIVNGEANQGGSEALLPSSHQSKQRLRQLVQKWAGL